MGTVSPNGPPCGFVRAQCWVKAACGVGRIAASVVRWARAVPLGIKHDLRRVGGLCAPNRTSAPALPGTSEPAALSAVLCCHSTAAATEANQGAFGGLFGCSRRLKKQGGPKNIFCKEKWEIRPLEGPKNGPIFFSHGTKIYTPER